jgi:hypothetical protein
MKNIIVVLVIFTMFSFQTRGDEKAAPVAANMQGKQANYATPMLFSPKDNGVEVSDLQLDYRLTESDELRIGPLTLDSQSVQMELIRQQPYSADNYLLQFSWPKKFLTSGKIEVRAAKTDFIVFNSDADLGKVQDFVTGTGDSKSVLALDQGHFEAKIKGKEFNEWKAPANFRFCFKKSENGLTNSLCSHLYSLNVEDGVYRLQDVRSAKKPSSDTAEAKSTSPLTVIYGSAEDATKTETIRIPINKDGIQKIMGGNVKDASKITMKQNGLKKKTVHIDESSYDRIKAIKKLAEWKPEVTFKFCAGDECSKDFKLAQTARDFMTQSEGQAVVATGDMPAEVRINDKPAAKKGSFALTDKEPKAVLVALFSNGGEFHIETQLPAAKTEYFDISSSQDKANITIAGRGPHPMSPEVTDMADPESSKSDASGAWKLTVPSDSLDVFIKGDGQIPLKQHFKISKKVPTEEMRPYLSAPTRTGTYAKSLPLTGKIITSAPVKISSGELEATQIDDNQFKWNYKSEERQKFNHSSILINDQGTEYHAYHPIYRALPYDVAGRVSGVLTTSSILLSGEFVGSAWLDSIFRNQNRLFSVQRWGLTAHYLQTFTSPQDASGNAITLSRLNADVKYRLKPGLTNHDPTFGAELSYQSLNYSSISAGMLGVGAFWFHQVPGFMDKAFNLVKWFRYPKWFELEAHLFPVGLSGVTMGSTYDANARLKIFVKENFYYDFTVNLNQYNYTTSAAAVSISYVSGAAGIGYLF